MTPRADAGDAARKRQLDGLAALIRSGFVLVVHESGIACTELAKAVIKQCDDRGIRAEPVSLEQVNLEALHLYAALFLVLPAPSAGGVDADVLARFETVYATYRAFREHDWTSVFTDQQSWWFTGTVHMLLWGRDAGEHCPFPVSDVDKLRVRQVTDPGTLGNVFDCYRPPPAPASYDSAADLLNAGVAHWTLAQSWGVRTLAEADAIYELIEQRREFYNNPAFPKMSNPRKTGTGNRFDQVLADPDQKFTDADLKPHQLHDNEAKRLARKAYKESGAKVVRDTLKKIRAQYPHVVRPDERANTRDNQGAFKHLYDALLGLHTLPAEVRDRITES